MRRRLSRARPRLSFASGDEHEAPRDSRGVERGSREQESTAGSSSAEVAGSAATRASAAAGAGTEELDQLGDEHVRPQRVERRRRTSMKRTNRWIRSRASGGTCGDSIAAVSAAIMSSLRRRAIWITRARSTWRSSIGGRASARTTAAASLGSTSSRIHATTSRTSARSRKAAPRTLLDLIRRERSGRGAARARSGGGHDPRIRAYPGRRQRSRASLRHARPGRGTLYRGRDRLGHGPADRRADRRLPVIRWRAGGLGGAARPRLRAARERVHGPAPARRAAATGDHRPAGVDRRQPAHDEAAAREDLPSRSAGEPGLLAGPLRSTSGFLLGAQLGAVTGVLSQRVLGQYDVSLLDASVPPRLLLLAPNLAHRRAQPRGRPRRAGAWVTIHEITHAVQFSGAPWLREHLGGMLRELLDGLQMPRAGLSSANGDGALAAGGSRRSAAKARATASCERCSIAPAAANCLRLGLGDERWQIVERMQATMSLIEGHAEHTMDAVGAEVLPSLPRLRSAMNRRRASRGLPWRVLERLLGLELKMRQYEVGRRFCDAVVADGGPQALARVWEARGALPTTAELRTGRVALPNRCPPHPSGANACSSCYKLTSLRSIPTGRLRRDRISVVTKSSERVTNRCSIAHPGIGPHESQPVPPRTARKKRRPAPNATRQDDLPPQPQSENEIRRKSRP